MATKQAKKMTADRNLLRLRTALKQVKKEVREVTGRLERLAVATAAATDTFSGAPEIYRGLDPEEIAFALELPGLTEELVQLASLAAEDAEVVELAARNRHWLR
jgi:hypothetical protein